MGTDTRLSVDVESATASGSTHSGAGGSHAMRAWDLDIDDGVVKMEAYALAVAGRTWAGAESIVTVSDSFRVERRCEGQVEKLEAGVALRTNIEGAVWADSGDSWSKIIGTFGVDRKPETFVSEEDDTDVTRDTTGWEVLDLDAGSHDTTVELITQAWAEDASKAESDAHSEHGLVETDDDRLELRSYEVFWRDASPPIVTLDVSGESHDGWYASPVRVSVDYADPETCVNIVKVFVDSETKRAWSPGSQQDPRSATLDLGTGKHKVAGQATNYQKAVTTSTKTVPVDASPPSSSSKVSCDRTEDGHCQDEATVAFECTDDETACESGDEIHYRVDGGRWRTGSSTTIDDPGEHEVEYYGVDKLGNVESTNSRTVKVVCGGATGPLERAIGTCAPS